MKRVVGGTKWWQVHDIQGCAPLVLCLSCYLTPGLSGGTDWLPSRSVPKRTGRTRRDAPKSAGVQLHTIALRRLTQSSTQSYGIRRYARNITYTDASSV